MASSNLNLYEIFNNQVKQFIDDVIVVFPGEDDLILVRSGFNVVKNMKPKIIHDIFEEHVIRNYKKQINEEDEKFFLNENYEKFEEVVKKEHGDISLM